MKSTGLIDKMTLKWHGATINDISHICAHPAVTSEGLQRLLRGSSCCPEHFGSMEVAFIGPHCYFMYYQNIQKTV